MIRSPPSADKTKTTVNSSKRSRPNDESDDTDELTLSSKSTLHQPSQPMTLDALFSAMNNQFALTLRRIEESNASITTKIDTVKAELEGKLEAVTRDINNFKDECASKFQVNETALSGLCEQVDGIRQDMGGLEKQDELIISGIPYLAEENLANYFKAILQERRAEHVQFAQTKIQFNEQQLYQLIHQYLAARGLSETASMLVKQTGITNLTPQSD